MRRRFCSAARLYAHAQFNFYIISLCNGIPNIPLLLAITEKRVSAPGAHKNNFFQNKIKITEIAIIIFNNKGKTITIIFLEICTIIFFIFFFLRKGEMLYAPSTGLRAPLVFGTLLFTQP